MNKNWKLQLPEHTKAMYWQKQEPKKFWFLREQQLDQSLQSNQLPKASEVYIISIQHDQQMKRLQSEKRQDLL